MWDKLEREREVHLQVYENRSGTQSENGTHGIVGRNTDSKQTEQRLQPALYNLLPDYIDYIPYLL